MRIFIFFLTITLSFFSFYETAKADTFSKFDKQKWYSSNKKFCIKICDSKVATLYKRAARSRRPDWSEELKFQISSIPQQVFISNDGETIAFLEFYYGNNHDLNSKVVKIFNNKGQIKFEYSLSEFVDVTRSLATTSGIIWLKKAYILEDSKSLRLILETLQSSQKEDNKLPSERVVDGPIFEIYPRTGILNMFINPKK